MEIFTLFPYVVAVVVVIILLYLIKKWITIYNKFQYWVERAKETFHDIDVILQERIDKLHAIAQIVKKYDIHEYKALKDVIGARSKWSKVPDLNEKVNKIPDVVSKVEDSLIRLQAVFERYPNLKADALHRDILSKDAHVESRLRKARLKYNDVVRKYNYRLKKFPRNIVARVHGFRPLEYMTFEGQEAYEPKEIFDE